LFCPQSRQGRKLESGGKLAPRWIFATAVDNKCPFVLVDHACPPMTALDRRLPDWRSLEHQKQFSHPDQGVRARSISATECAVASRCQPCICREAAAEDSRRKNALEVAEGFIRVHCSAADETKGMRRAYEAHFKVLFAPPGPPGVAYLSQPVPVRARAANPSFQV
jgi:hypothetical protein